MPRIFLQLLSSCTDILWTADCIMRAAQWRQNIRCPNSFHCARVPHRLWDDCYHMERRAISYRTQQELERLTEVRSGSGVHSVMFVWVVLQYLLPLNKPDIQTLSIWFGSILFSASQQGRPDAGGHKRPPRGLQASWSRAFESNWVRFRPLFFNRPGSGWTASEMPIHMQSTCRPLYEILLYWLHYTAL